MSTIGDILDEFFSPFSSEKLWVMPEDDDYTVIVRRWQPVIDSVNRAKSNLASTCPSWQSFYVSNSSWKPTMTDSPKPGAYRDFVPSPPGTDPETCKQAFVIYAISKAAPGPTIQTNDLYTCSIGSFNIYTTVNSVDCVAKTARMNFWMYNSMSKRSFGKFADNPVFALCGMKTQYMWWNWVETVEWTSGTVTTIPRPASGNWW